MKHFKFTTLFLFLFCASLLTGFTRSDDNTSKDQTKYVLYYLHNTFRCYSCNRIEALSKSAILGGKIETPGKSNVMVDATVFAKQVKDGKLSFESVNVDKKENKHYLTDLLCKAKFPAIAEYKDGKIVRTKTFNNVWKMVHGDPKKFVAYIQKSVAEFINKK